MKLCVTLLALSICSVSASLRGRSLQADKWDQQKADCVKDCGGAYSWSSGGGCKCNDGSTPGSKAAATTPAPTPDVTPASTPDATPASTPDQEPGQTDTRASSTSGLSISGWATVFGVLFGAILGVVGYIYKRREHKAIMELASKELGAQAGGGGNTEQQQAKIQNLVEMSKGGHSIQGAGIDAGINHMKTGAAAVGSSIKGAKTNKRSELQAKAEAVMAAENAQADLAALSPRCSV